VAGQRTDPRNAGKPSLLWDHLDVPNECSIETYVRASSSTEGSALAKSFQRVNAHMSATGSGSPIWPRAGADPQGWLPLLSRGAPLPMHLQAMRSEEPSDAFHYPAEGPIRDGCAARRRLFPATREVSQAGPSRPALSASGVRIAAFDYRFRDLLDGFRGQEPAGPVTKTCTEDFIRWRHARAPRASGGRRWPGPRG
jgi:hypothetical protein